MARICMRFRSAYELLDHFNVLVGRRELQNIGKIFSKAFPIQLLLEISLTQ